VPNVTATVWLGIAASWAAVRTPGWRTAPVTRTAPGSTGGCAGADEPGVAEALAEAVVEAVVAGAAGAGGAGAAGVAAAHPPDHSSAASATAAEKVDLLRAAGCGIPAAYVARPGARFDHDVTPGDVVDEYPSPMSWGGDERGRR
jgi:hypothetical protein